MTSGSNNVVERPFETGESNVTGMVRRFCPNGAISLMGEGASTYNFHSMREPLSGDGSPRAWTDRWYD